MLKQSTLKPAFSGSPAEKRKQAQEAAYRKLGFKRRILVARGRGK